MPENNDRMDENDGQMTVTSSKNLKMIPYCPKTIQNHSISPENNTKTMSKQPKMMPKPTLNDAKMA